MKNISKVRNGTISAAIALVVGSGVMLTTAQQAQAQWVVTDPGHTFQTILSESKRALDAASDYANQAQQLQTQMRQYEDMVKQGLSLADPRFDSLKDTLSQLSSLYSQGNSLAHSLNNLEGRFQEQYAGYEDYLSSVVGGTAVTSNRYKKWADTGFDNARLAMTAAGINTSAFDTEEASLQQLVNRSASAAGRLQAIQAGNEISAQQVQQIQRLRELVASQITLQSNWVAQQTERTALDDAFRATFNSGTVQGTGANKGY